MIQVKNIVLGVVIALIIALIAAGLWFFVFKKEMSQNNSGVLVPAGQDEINNQPADEVDVGPDQTSYDLLPDNDKDADGLTDEEEKSLGTNPDKYDTDDDGLSDRLEVQEYNTDPTKADSDGDGYRDDRELFYGYNPLGEGTLE